MICNTCKQPIKAGEIGATGANSGLRYHNDPTDCVAATEAATARKCAEIVRDADVQTCGGYERQDDGRATLAEAVKDIRRAYPAAFAKEEGK